MKLSPDASRKANIVTWNPASLEDRPQVHQRRQPAYSGGRDGILAESLFGGSAVAPAIADDFNEQFSGKPSGPMLDEGPYSADEKSQTWLSNKFGHERPMEDCCENWVPGEIKVEPVGLRSAPAAPDVENIRQAALSVAREAVLETMRQEAEQITAQARSQAAEIISEARNNAEEELCRARQEGLTAARDQTESMLQMLAILVAETQAWQASLMRRSERLTLGLVQDIAARLFGEGFKLDPATLGLTFERALAEAKSLGDLRVRAHPDDLSMLGDLWPAHQTALRGQRIEMIPDLDIQRGSCFIDGQFGSVDSRLDTQLRVINERLDQELAESERPDKNFVPLSPEDLSA